MNKANADLRRVPLMLEHASERRSGSMSRMHRHGAGHRWAEDAQQEAALSTGIGQQLRLRTLER